MKVAKSRYGMPLFDLHKRPNAFHKVFGVACELIKEGI